jgi:hypothetical protein
MLREIHCVSTGRTAIPSGHYRSLDKFLTNYYCAAAAKAIFLHLHNQGFTHAP